MADYKTRAGNIQDEPGTSCSARTYPFTFLQNFIVSLPSVKESRLQLLECWWWKCGLLTIWTIGLAKKFMRF